MCTFSDTGAFSSRGNILKFGTDREQTHRQASDEGLRSAVTVNEQRFYFTAGLQQCFNMNRSQAGLITAAALPPPLPRGLAVNLCNTSGPGASQESGAFSRGRGVAQALLYAAAPELLRTIKAAAAPKKFVENDTRAEHLWAIDSTFTRNAWGEEGAAGQRTQRAQGVQKKMCRIDVVALAVTRDCKM